MQWRHSRPKQKHAGQHRCEDTDVPESCGGRQLFITTFRRWTWRIRASWSAGGNRIERLHTGQDSQTCLRALTDRHGASLWCECGHSKPSLFSSSVTRYGSDTVPASSDVVHPSAALKHRLVLLFFSSYGTCRLRPPEI
jgi:hypothetical protein